MKRKVLLAIVTLLILTAGLSAWKFFGPSLHAPKKRYFYVSTGETIESVKKHLVDSNVVGGTMWLSWATKMVGYTKVRAGRYEIKGGMSLLRLVRMLKNGAQSPVNLVVVKFRTREALAARIGNNFECDSLSMIAFLDSNDSLRAYGLDTATAMAAVLPLTYSINWNTTPRKVFDQFFLAYKSFWTDARKARADSLGITPVQAVTIASIIDEETNSAGDKPKIASVYLNRVAKGMPLQADPTLKYALRNFGLRRIYDSHKLVVSAYNTYLNKGLPPGPICTPMTQTVDAVLDSPKTDYLYFVANSTLDGTSIFTSKYDDHIRFAKLYQDELNKRNIR